MIARTRIVLATLIVSAVCGAQTPLQGLDAVIEDAMRTFHVPGLAIAVVKDDKVVHAKGHGVREMGKPDKVDEHTLFAIASNSKAFTCAVIGSLRDEKKLSWNDRVIEHLPGFQMHDPWVTRDIRVLDLVCHRSGLATFGGDHLWIASNYDRNEVLRRVRYLEPTAPFRYRFQYQNLMYVAAGEVAAAVGGKSFETLLKERLIEPLGMKDTLLTMTELRAAKNVATPHERRDDKLKIVAYDDADVLTAAGGIKSNVVDVARWLRCHLNDGKLDGKQVLSRQTVREMQQVLMPRGGGGYGMGWAISDYAGRRVVAHGGGLSGMISRTAFVPSEKLGVVVLTNMANNGLPSMLTYWIIDRYLGREDRNRIADLERNDRRRHRVLLRAEQRLQATRQKDTKPSLPLQAFTGRYHDAASGDAHVTLRDGKLFFAYNPRHEGPLEHWHHDTFRVTWTDPIFDMPFKAMVTFVKDQHGNVKRLETQFYDAITFDRVNDR